MAEKKRIITQINMLEYQYVLSAENWKIFREDIEENLQISIKTFAG